MNRRLPNANATPRRRSVRSRRRPRRGAARVAAARDEREGEKRKPVFRRKEDDVRGPGRRDARRGGREARLFSGDDVRSRLGGARRRVADAGLPPRRRRAGRRAVRRRGDGDAGGARQAVHYLAPAQGRRDRPVANDARVPRPRREDLARRRDDEAPARRGGARGRAAPSPLARRSGAGVSASASAALGGVFFFRRLGDLLGALWGWISTFLGLCDFASPATVREDRGEAARRRRRLAAAARPALDAPRLGAGPRGNVHTLASRGGGGGGDPDDESTRNRFDNGNSTLWGGGGDDPGDDGGGGGGGDVSVF